MIHAVIHAVHSESERHRLALRLLHGTRRALEPRAVPRQPTHAGSQHGVPALQQHRRVFQRTFFEELGEEGGGRGASLEGGGDKRGTGKVEGGCTHKYRAHASRSPRSRPLRSNAACAGQGGKRCDRSLLLPQAYSRLLAAQSTKPTTDKCCASRGRR